MAKHYSHLKLSLFGILSGMFVSAIIILLLSLFAFNKIEIDRSGSGFSSMEGAAKMIQNAQSNR